MSKQVQIPEGFWQDANGNLIPEKNVREIDKKRDALVHEIVEQAKAHSGLLTDFKAQVQSSIAEFVQESAAALKAKVRNAKGNVTLLSYDGRYKVQSVNSDFIEFDERLQVAKSLVDKCIRKWSGGANDNLLVLINSAFDVDKGGNISASKILGLKKHDIDDPDWKKAMEAISQSVTVVSSKNYVRFYERQDGGEYKQISLNIAAE